MVAMNPESESSGNPMGELVRRLGELAELSMRQVAEMTGISNPYLSQIEHGLRAPSEAVLETIAATLGVPPETLRPGADDDHGLERDRDHEDDQPPGDHASVVAAISADPGLTARQRRALTEIYAAMTEATAGRRTRRSS